jgi:hypothetical protein
MAYQHLWRATAGRSLPIFVAAATSFGNDSNRCYSSKTDCSAAAPAVEPPVSTTTTKSTNDDGAESSSTKVFQEGFQPKAEGYYADLFPKRQLWQPKMEYPQWCVQ